MSAHDTHGAIPKGRNHGDPRTGAKVLRKILRPMGAAIAGSILVAFGFSATARAQTFAPIACSTSSYTDIPFDFTTADFPEERNCVPSGADPCPHYSPNYHNLSYLVANQYVNRLRFRYAEFETESGWDHLKYGRNGGTLTTETGYVAPNTTRTIDSSSGNSFQSEGGRLEFTSDSIIGDEGFIVDQMSARCASSPATGTQLSSMAR